MTEPQLLRAAGMALFPERSWKADMGIALDVGARRVRYWANGGESVPPGIWDDILALLERKRIVVRAATDEISRLIIARATESED